ncbi:unnamed protein product, partial [Laminaria digitata]
MTASNDLIYFLVCRERLRPPTLVLSRLRSFVLLRIRTHFSCRLPSKLFLVNVKNSSAVRFEKRVVSAAIFFLRTRREEGSPGEILLVCVVESRFTAGVRCPVFPFLTSNSAVMNRHFFLLTLLLRKKLSH